MFSPAAAASRISRSCRVARARASRRFHAAPAADSDARNVRLPQPLNHASAATAPAPTTATIALMTISSSTISSVCLNGSARTTPELDCRPLVGRISLRLPNPRFALATKANWSKVRVAKPKIVDVQSESDRENHAREARATLRPTHAWD